MWPFIHKPTRTAKITFQPSETSIFKNLFTCRPVFILTIAFIILSQLIFSQSAEIEYNTFIGINPAHTVILQAVSRTMDPEISYFPLHIHINHSLTRHLALSGLLMYRLDKDGEYFLTHEFGVALGPSYTIDRLNGLYVDLKTGLGYAFGTDYNDSEYIRTDLIIEPDIGYYIDLNNRLSLIVGLGLQTLVKLSESYYGYVWEWNSTGKLSHYYLPVVNVTLGVKL